MPHSRLTVLAVQSCLVFLIAVSSAANCLAQCSFSNALLFDPQVFPEFPTGSDGNNYPDEGAALTAAKRTYWGPAGVYPSYSIDMLCRGKHMSWSMSFVKGGGPGQIIANDVGNVIYFADFPGRSVLVQQVRHGYCSVDGSGAQFIAFTRDFTYTDGQILRCAAPLSVTLALTGPTETRPLGTGGISIITLTAKVTSNGAPQPGVGLGFSTGVTANSGGHDHDVNRPKGTLGATQGVTDANGEFKLSFQAPEASGTHTIKANCATCSNTVVTKEIQVKVPSLVEMLADTVNPATYTLVGATGNHKSNHWFTSASVATLPKVVDAMFATGWGTVGLNDGSLIWGGLFDIKGGWVPSHNEHRMGTEVDISVTNPRSITDEQKKKTYAQLCKRDNTAFSVQTLWHQDDGYPEHFHMYLNGTGLTSQAGGGPCCTHYKTTRAKVDKSGNPVLDKNGKPVQETVALCEETSPR